MTRWDQWLLGTVVIIPLMLFSAGAQWTWMQTAEVADAWSKDREVELVRLWPFDCWHRGVLTCTRTRNLR